MLGIICILLIHCFCDKNTKSKENIFIKTVLEELKDNTNTQFDELIVKLFILDML